MRNFTKFTVAAICAFSAAVSASAQNRTDLLWVIGDATPYGWSCDDATAIVAPSDSKVYTGTMYLEAGKDFKFLTKYDFGNMEYHAEDANATPGADGKVKLVYTAADPDNKIHVTESANYLITVDTEALEATIVKSDYQESQVRYASLFIVGSVLTTGYAVDEGLVMIQDAQSPMTYAADAAELGEGSFKIATALKGAGTWNPQYWYFRDVDDASKMVLNAEGDNQWSVEKAGKYNVKANLLTNTLNIEDATSSGIDAVVSRPADGPATYYTIDGRKIANPASGSLVIKIAADGTATKVRF